MKRRFRVKTRREFHRVYEKGRSFANRTAVLYATAIGGGASRVGFAAGRKLGSAVVRNRAKRRLREAVRQLWPEIKGGGAFVLIARKPALEIPFSDLVKKTSELFRRAGYLKKRDAAQQGLGEEKQRRHGEGTARSGAEE